MTARDPHPTQSGSYPGLDNMMIGFAQMQEFRREPFVVARADGIYFWDDRGRQYIDGLSGIFVVNLGHNNRRVIGAMKEQMEQLLFPPPLHSTNAPALELSRLLAEVAPGDLEVSMLLSGGSEATETAMKLARQYHRQTGNPQKYKILGAYGSYHGGTLGALSAGGGSSRRSPFEPLAGGFLHFHPAHCARCGLGLSYPTCQLACARLVEDIILQEDPATVAALIIEPIINTAGTAVPPDDYLPYLREICDRHDVLLIFDEVITGFGRTGDLFASLTFDTTPDILCLGKGMSSGYAPLAATLFRRRLADAFLGEPEEGVAFVHAHTYGGNPVAAVAGLANIRELVERKLPENARGMGAYLMEKLEQLRSLEIFGQVRGKGLMVGVDLVRDPSTGERFPDGGALGLRIGKEALRRGLLIRSYPHHLTFAPPLIIDREQIDAMMGIFDEAVRDVLRDTRLS